MERVLCVDSGLRAGVDNIAFDRHGLARHGRGDSPALLRFWRSAPTASLGAHQAVDRELRLDYCSGQGIAVVRRPSGGGAVYVDERQLGYSLIIARPWFGRNACLAAVLERFAAGVARGLDRLGIAAQYKRPNDLEVSGRKISSFFVASSASSLLLHGTVLLAADIKAMLLALRVPTEKLSPDGLAAARDRLITVGECLGSVPPADEIRQAIEDGIAAVLGLSTEPGGADAYGFGAVMEGSSGIDEHSEPGSIDWRDPGHEWTEALTVTDGGSLRARARFADGDRFQRVEFAADLQFVPPDLLVRMAHALVNVSAASADSIIASVMADSCAEPIGFNAADVVHVVRLLADKQRVRRELGLAAADANALMVQGSEQDNTRAILERASVMLVPYCAKPTWCELRHEDACSECGLCEVGEAYRLARERGMQVATITSYEHLVATLSQMRADGEPAYVGMCCSNFFIKRFRAFRDAGIPAVLMDISGANCYELHQEDQAYAGTFAAQARVNEELLEQVMRFVPPAK